MPYLRVGDDPILFEIGQEVSSVYLTVVVPELFICATGLLIEQGRHADDGHKGHQCDWCTKTEVFVMHNFTNMGITFCEGRTMLRNLSEGL